MIADVVRRMAGRDPAEPHRVSTPLELFFDLTVVVAIAQCASGLHHGLAEGHASESVQPFLMVFFAVWWAWMNFTWFASAYDTDDALYRSAVFVQMAGSLVIAAGVSHVFENGDFTVVTVGYLIMRVGLVSLWLRAACAGTDRREPLRYAFGLMALQCGWLLLLLLSGPAAYAGFATLVVLELTLPFWAEQGHPVKWHPHHIAERYGLFTIIVLGESVLGITNAVQSAFDSNGAVAELAVTAIGAFLVVFAMWWLYFDQPSLQVAASAHTSQSRRIRRAVLWGYGHYGIFASAAATGAALTLQVDIAAHHAEVGELTAALAITVPVGIYTFLVWALHVGEHPAGYRAIKPYVVTALVFASSWTPQPVLSVGIVLTVALAMRVISAADTSATSTQKAKT